MIQSYSMNSTSSLISPDVSGYQSHDIKPVKLGVMASGNGSKFEVVAQAIKSGDLNAQIQVLIYNNPLAKAAERALNHGVEAILLNHRHYLKRIS